MKKSFNFNKKKSPVRKKEVVVSNTIKKKRNVTKKVISHRRSKIHDDSNVDYNLNDLNNDIEYDTTNNQPKSNSQSNDHNNNNNNATARNIVYETRSLPPITCLQYGEDRAMKYPLFFSAKIAYHMRSI
jgi:hypothetical protein